MSNETSAAIQDKVRDGIEMHRATYLSSGGAQGHIMDATANGGRTLAMNCLIRYRGRKSGKVMITALTYSLVGGEVVIIASKGGADQHPAWYLNLKASEFVDFQIATQAYRAIWREPEGAEREQVWAVMAGNYPFYAAYQASTDRRIPVVMMQPVEAISVFKPEDIA